MCLSMKVFTKDKAMLLYDEDDITTRLYFKMVENTTNIDFEDVGVDEIKAIGQQLIHVFKKTYDRNNAEKTLGFISSYVKKYGCVVIEIKS